MADPKQSRAVTFDTSAVGDTGLKQFGGYISEEFAKELQGTNAARVYNQMANNDPTIGAMLFAIRMLIRGAKWHLKAADESDAAVEAREFVDGVLFKDMDDPWSSVIEEACSMFEHGHAPMEVVWKRRGGEANDPKTRSMFSDNQIGVRTISLRAQATIQRWEIDEDGAIVGLYQQPWSGGVVFIPIEKLLLFRTTRLKNNPEGRSVIRTAWRPWIFKTRMEEIEGIGVERDLAGLPVAYLPPELFDPAASPAEKAQLEFFKRTVANVKRDKSEGLLLPSVRDEHNNLRYELKLLSTGGSRSFDTTKIIDRYDHRIATTVLADFIFLGQQAVGSFALSSSKTALFATAIGGFMKSIADVFNRDLIPRLWFLNAYDPALMPELVPGDIEHPDLTEIGEFLGKMTAAGAQMFPDRKLEDHLREIAGLPPAPEESEAEIDPRYEQRDEAAPKEEDLERAMQEVAPEQPPKKRARVIKIHRDDGSTFSAEVAG